MAISDADKQCQAAPRARGGRQRSIPAATGRTRTNCWRGPAPRSATRVIRDHLRDNVQKTDRKWRSRRAEGCIPPLHGKHWQTMGRAGASSGKAAGRYGPRHRFLQGDQRQYGTTPAMTCCANSRCEPARSISGIERLPLWRRGIRLRGCGGPTCTSPAGGGNVRRSIVGRTSASTRGTKTIEVTISIG